MVVAGALVTVCGLLESVVARVTGAENDGEAAGVFVVALLSLPEFWHAVKENATTAKPKILFMKLGLGEIISPK